VTTVSGILVRGLPSLATIVLLLVAANVVLPGFVEVALLLVIGHF
jgi:hypothetical protein